MIVTNIKLPSYQSLLRVKCLPLVSEKAGGRFVLMAFTNQLGSMGTRLVVFLSYISSRAVLAPPLEIYFLRDTT